MPQIDFSSLVEDSNYLVDLGRGVWLMDDHRWALKVWETERKSGQYTLIHADFHWDGCYDFHGYSEMEDRLLGLTPEQICQLVAKGEWVRCDSFITPAIRRGLVHTVHFYCFQEGPGDDAIDPDFLKICNAKQYIHSDASSLAAAEIVAPFIFDLCLDLFNNSDKWSEGNLWSDAEVIEFLVTTAPLIRKAEMVTISMSFNYSGTASDTQHLTKLVVPKILACRECS